MGGGAESAADFFSVSVIVRLRSDRSVYRRLTKDPRTLANEATGKAIKVGYTYRHRSSRCVPETPYDRV